jgi:hypothetical protein
VADILHEDCTCDDFLSYTLVWVGGVFVSMVYRSIPVLCRIRSLSMDILGCYDSASVALSIAQTVVCDVVVQLLASLLPSRLICI